MATVIDRFIINFIVEIQMKLSKSLHFSILGTNGEFKFNVKRVRQTRNFQRPMTTVAM